MNELLPIRQLGSHFISGSCFQPQFEKCKSYICTHPLVNRVITNWQVTLTDCSTIIAISCCVITFFTGHTILCPAFAIIAISSGVSAFYMRRFSVLSNLENSARELKEAKENFEQIAQNLERENSRLFETQQELQQTNENFRMTNRELQTTNETLQQTNARLTNQVTQLTLQATQLRESAEKIKTEMLRFRQENSHLHNNVHGFNQSLVTLDQQILASRALCEQITNHLASQQQGLGEQLEQLRQYLSELRTENRVYERIQALGALHQQIQQGASQLQDIQLQYATERANFQTIHEALVQLRNQFDSAIRDAVSSMQSNNQQFRNNMTLNQQQLQNEINALSAERQRIQQMLERYGTLNAR